MHGTTGTIGSLTVKQRADAEGRGGVLDWERRERKTRGGEGKSGRLDFDSLRINGEREQPPAGLVQRPLSSIWLLHVPGPPLGPVRHTSTTPTNG